MKKYQKSIDIFRLISAGLVVAIHTAPLLGINEFANYFLVQIIARIAVPFFFCISGYYFFQKLKKTDDYQGVLFSFLKQNLKFYFFSCLLYLPLYFLNHPDFNVFTLFWDVVYHGLHYHLWYFPAIMLGAVVVTFLYKYLKNYTLPILSVLYIIGSLLNVYLPLFPTEISGGMHQILEVISTARNGIFFAPIFFYLGFTIENHKPNNMKLFCVSMLYLIEGLMTVEFGYGNAYTCMYISLLFLIPELIAYLLSKPGYTENEALHQIPMYIYILHPWIIVVVEKIYAYFQLDLSNFLLYFYTFTFSSICALFLSCIITKTKKIRQVDKTLEISKDNDIIEKY